MERTIIGLTDTTPTDTTTTDTTTPRHRRKYHHIPSPDTCTLNS